MITQDPQLYKLNCRYKHAMKSNDLSETTNSTFHHLLSATEDYSNRIQDSLPLYAVEFLSLVGCYRSHSTKLEFKFAPTFPKYRLTLIGLGL
jgi:hypothetical protein